MTETPLNEVPQPRADLHGAIAHWPSWLASRGAGMGTLAKPDTLNWPGHWLAFLGYRGPGVDAFLNASPAEALATARAAADGQDVRIGGGPTVVRDFLAAGLVDHMHLVQVPIVLGRGFRIWDGLEALEQAYEIEAVSSPSRVTHLTFMRTVVS